MDGKAFHQELLASGYEYFVGVPDSVLSDWIDYASKDNAYFQIAGQEGEALSLAIGYHLATRKKAVVFLQNSGLGNLINPLMSMAHAEVFRVPVLLVIGWRGAPGMNDEPQHRTMGLATQQILQACQVESTVVQSITDLQTFLRAQGHSHHQSLTALLIEPGRLSIKASPRASQQTLRIHYLEALLQLAPQNAVFFSTTGFTSRELWALQKERRTHPCFYSVGGMGFVNAIGLGFSLFQAHAHTCVLDGDGAFLMHMGNAASIAERKPQRFLHILLRNDVHESTGAQALAAQPESWAAIAKAIGYGYSDVVQNFDEFVEIIPQLFHRQGPVLLEVKIPKGTLDGLPRPTGTPREWLETFWEPR